MNFLYPENLPITAKKDVIISAIQHHQVIIVAGDTGSGKTTQLPKLCLEALPDEKRIIGCTQPRRIAATSVASRVAEELGPLRDIVGYKIRFHDHTTSSTKIKFMTDGVLLAESRHDPSLRRYGVIIVDEAHERSLNIDFLLGYLRQLLEKRPDLKIIITSATIDTEAFAKHFDNAPVIKVSGRTFPVTVQYLPQEKGDEEVKDSMLDHCVQVVSNLVANRPEGDILVFLPTERDIRECCRLLEHQASNATILPLFGRLPSGEQQRIFKRTSRLKVVVATNVAETSVTVPGIRYVVDSGLARISHYNVRAKTTSLPVTRISQASCDQRKGRCGRIGPGLCIRLYSEEDYEDRDEYTLPELKRSNLAEVILQMISLNLGRPEDFPFLDAPFKTAIKEGYRLLTELDAIDSRMQLTSTGEIMADLPIDPCISRIIIEANSRGCLKEIKIIASILAIQDPKIRPSEKEQLADNAHQKFNDKHSDFIGFLNIWNSYHDELTKGRSWSKLKKFCKTNYLSFQRMREWFDLHDQLDRILKNRVSFSNNSSPASYEQIHKSLMVGFLRNLARKKSGKIYQGAQNKELMIFPGSHLFGTSSQWVLAASFIETNRLYGLTVAAIESEWIEEVGSHLCKYSWSNPRYHKKSGQVLADETASLFGLIISSGRKVNFPKRSTKNVPEARQLFIDAALVYGELVGRYRFLQNNLKLLNKWRESESKLRAKNIVADDTSIYQFYDTSLPTHVCDRPTLNKFLKRNRNHSELFMKDEDVVLRSPDQSELINFPSSIAFGNLEIELEYTFEPGSSVDGITFKIPVQFARTLQQERFEWLVPGLLEEKITFLLKSLPKTQRKKLVPVSESVARVLDDLDFGTGSFLGSLENSILKLFRILISRSDWSGELPQHLQPRFTITQAKKEIGSGRDLNILIQNLEKIDVPTVEAKANNQDQKTLNKWDNQRFTIWDFKELPNQVTLYSSVNDVAGFLYPMLVEQPDLNCVQLRFTQDIKEAAETNRSGNLFLFRLQFAEQFKALKKMCSTRFSGESTLWLAKSGSGRKELINSLLQFILSAIFGQMPEEVVEKKIFEQKVEHVSKAGFFKIGQQKLDQILQMLRQRRTAQKVLEKHLPTQGLKSLQKRFTDPKRNEFHKLLVEILPPDFLTSRQGANLTNISRQLQSFTVRVERYYANPSKDAQKEQQLDPYVKIHKELLVKKADMPEEARKQLDFLTDMIGEYRISLFSPEIKTAFPVSPKKLDKQIQTIRNCS